MAKRKRKPQPKQPKAETRPEPLPGVAVSNRLLLVCTGLAAAVYFLFSYLSDGFYSDDEIAHYLNALAFFEDPSSILGYWHRPGYKLVYALPALAGVKAAHLAMALTTAFTAYFAARTARRLGLAMPVLAFVFVAAAPFLYQIAFRTYTETFAAFLVALLLFFYTGGRWGWTAITATYLFTVRQEYALVALMLGVLFLARRKFGLFLILGASPVVLGILGWMKSGDPLWLWNIYMQFGAGDRFAENVPKPGFGHFSRLYLSVFGTVGGVLSVVGLMSWVPALSEGKTGEHFRRYHALYLIAVPIFLIQSVLTSNLVSSPSPGNLKYIISLTPVVALLATLGFQTLWTRDRRRSAVGWSVVGVMAICILAFLSYKYNHYTFTTTRDWSKLIVLAALSAGLVLALWRGLSGSVAVGMTAALVVIHTVVAEPPLKLDPQRKAVAEMVEWYRANGMEGRETLVNHPYFYYLLGVPTLPDGRMRPLRHRAIKEATPGTVIIFDSHYGNRPAYDYDVKLEDLERSPRVYRRLNEVRTEHTGSAAGGHHRAFGIFAYELYRSR